MSALLTAVINPGGGSATTLPIPDPPAGCRIALVSVVASGTTGTLVTAAQLGFGSLDAAGTGTRTIYLPAAASMTIIPFCMNFGEDGLGMYRSAGTGYQIVLTSIGGSWVTSSIIACYRVEKLTSIPQVA